MREGSTRHCGKNGKKGEAHKGKGSTTRTCIKVREKRLDAAMWRCDEAEYGGGHFPICAFTNDAGRRSAEAHRRRSAGQDADG